MRIMLCNRSQERLNLAPRNDDLSLSQKPRPVVMGKFDNTGEPVLSGPVLSGYPLLSGQLSKSRKLLPLITVILTSIKRAPLLSGRGHPLLSPDELFLLS